MKRKKFWKVITREEAQTLFADLPTLEEETIGLSEALGRISARDVHSPADVPHFVRSSMDGFAVKAQDTYGATETSPIKLEVVGEIAVGAEPTSCISEGEVLAISTGGMLPSGADAVLMIEYARPLEKNAIGVIRPVAPGENVSQIGEDISKGSPILRKGKPIRAQEVGALASVGITQVPVFRRPRVGILSTGNELVSPETDPAPGQVRGINSLTISALIQQYGALPIDFGIVSDCLDEIRALLDEALSSSDLVAISGGSSVGQHDLTLDVIQSFDRSEILAHGLAIRPGKPTILAKVRGKPVIGLPGHPVSAMIVFSVVARPMLLRMLSRSDGYGDLRTAHARLSQNVASASGREDYLRVSLEAGQDQIIARPILGKSAAISTMVRADGLVRIPLEKEGLEAGELVQVELF